MAPLTGRVEGVPLLRTFVSLCSLDKEGDVVSWLTRIRADGRLREKHMRMAKTGDRPAFLEEYYVSHHNLEREAERLVELGYRIRSRQDMRDANGYRATFIYVGEPDRSNPMPLETGRRSHS